MLQKAIDLLFFLVIVLAIGLFIAARADADTSKAMTALRKTAIRIEGVSCLGSGSIVEGHSGRKFAISNNHVCNCSSEQGYFYATQEDGTLIKAKIVKRSWAYDLCAGLVEDSRPALKLGHAPGPMSEVSSRGYPGGRLVETHGRIGGSTQWTWNAGIEMMGTCPAGAQKLYALNGNVAGCALSFTSTLTNLYGRPGSSGSAVVNNDGELVGVLSSWMPDSDYSAGMVPYSQLKEFVGGL